MGEISVIAAIGLGLLGTTHCLGMCGGIAAGFGMGNTHNRNAIARIILFNGGRVASYAILGGIFGLLGNQLMVFPINLILRLLAAALLIAMGLYVAGWWNGITRLEKLGQHIWKHIQPMTARQMPERTLRSAMILGLLWGFLPCGLVYSTLMWAAVAGDPWHSSLLMAGFGIGTLPGMVLTGIFAQRVRALLQRRDLRQIAGLLIIVFGFYSIPWHMIAKIV